MAEGHVYAHTSLTDGTPLRPPRPAPRPAPPLTLHLDQELGLDPPRRLALVLAPGAAERVDLVDEDDGRPVLSGQSEQALHQPGGRRRVQVQCTQQVHK